MMVWKMIFLFQRCILRFHVDLPGCNTAWFIEIPPISGYHDSYTTSAFLLGNPHVTHVSPLPLPPVERFLLPKECPPGENFGRHMGVEPKMVGFTNKFMGFPTKNDQHLGCEMGVPPFKETPISTSASQSSEPSTN